MSWSALLFLGEDVLSQTAGWKTELHDAEAPFWRFENIFSIFCGKMLDGGVEKAHKAIRANEPATSERMTGKEIFPDGKKVLDAGLKMRHKSPSRQRVAPTGPRKKLSRKWKKTCWQRKRSGVNNCFAPSESVWFIDKWIANGKELWDSDFRPTEIFATDLNWRVWFWLRLNAGGVLNTCKSYAKGTSVPSKVAHGWVTRG